MTEEQTLRGLEILILTLESQLQTMKEIAEGLETGQKFVPDKKWQRKTYETHQTPRYF